MDSENLSRQTDLPQAPGKIDRRETRMMTPDTSSAAKKSQIPGRDPIPPTTKPLSGPRSRWIVSPVEGLILAGVLGGFLYSVSTLFQEKDTFTALLNPDSGTTGLASDMSSDSQPERTPASKDDGQSESMDRDPASAPTLLKQFDFRCDISGESATEAGKIRLSGPFCAAGGGASADSPLKTSIINEANQFSATVFMDASIRKFSTDYIPLANGANPISVEFRYASGASVKKSFTLQRK